MNYTFNYDVSVILVNYNGKKYIDALFDSLIRLEHDDFTFEVVFVDNNSSDGSVEYLEQNYKDKCNLNIVETGENKGFAGGNNAGVAASSGRYVVLLNNDTAVDPKWLTNLYHFMQKHPECGMANSKLLFFYDFIKLTFETSDKVILNKEIRINGKEYTIDSKFCKNLLYEPDQLVCFGHTEISVPLIEGLKSQSDYQFEFEVKSTPAGSKIKCEIESVEAQSGKVLLELDNSKIQEFRYSLIQNAGSGINQDYDGFDIGFCEKDSEKYQKSYELTNGCGASIMMLREDFDKAGCFDERFFMYYEDTDLSLRIRKLGKKILFCPDSIVRHIHTGSSKEWSPFFTYHVYRNKLLMIGKNVSKKAYWKYFLQQYYLGIRHRDPMKRKGTMDSLKILRGNNDVHYEAQ